MVFDETLQFDILKSFFKTDNKITKNPKFGFLA